MARFTELLCVLCLLFCWTSCDEGSSPTQELPPYNPNVEAFTSGQISRYSSVRLIFSQEIPAERMDEERLDQLVHLKPDVAGRWFFEDNRTLVFKPERGFERNKAYRVVADLSEWFEVEGEDKLFSFGFHTLPLALRGNLESLDVNSKNENGYDVRAVLYTPDKESAETVEGLVAFSEPVNAVWRHGPDGKKHEVTMSNVPAGTDGSRRLTLSITANKQGLKKGELFSALIPDQNDFSVYDVAYVSEPERYVEVSFTKLLDEGQEMRGLAFISDNASENVSVEGNKLRLYPDASQTKSGVMNIHLNQGIRSKSGLNMKETVVRQIQIDELKPNVRFIGKGVIIPRSERISIPFQAIYLRGVTVSVIKILERNIGQFLQMNDLDGSGELTRVGRLVARETIFLDEEGLDLSQWNTFAIDLKRLMEPELGAIYRLELSFDRSLSAYPCGNDSVTISKERIRALDKVRFKEESEKFDEGGYYYYQYDWSNYDWKKRDDPCSDSYYFNKVESKNILTTDLGLVAMMGENDEMTVLVHNLQDTRPERNVKVTAYNYQHQPLATGMTDEKGQARLVFPSGRPFYLIASSGDQRSYLRVDNGSALSLSSFDVSGEKVQKGIKGFIYGERGVWRPGDTLHLGFMLNDRLERLPKNHPVVMELYNPLGQVYARKTQTQGQLGLYRFDFVTEADAPTGAWNVKTQVGGVSFSKRLRVESIKPNRLKIDFTLPSEKLLRGEPINARLHTEWMQGATARDLKYDIQGTFIATSTHFDNYKDFCFDDPSRTFHTEESQLFSGKTNARGDAVIQARFEVGKVAPGMLLANLVTRVYEESGDFSIDGIRTLYSPYRRYVGLRSPQKDKSQLDTGKEYTYDVASVNHEGKPVPDTELEVKIYKVYWYWWWNSNTEGLANYVSDSYNKPVKTLTIRTGVDGRGSFPLSFPDKEWGTYFISVKDKKSGHSTGVMSYFDWPNNEGRRDANGNESATMLTFKTDKENYKPGEKLVVTFPSTKGSRAIISIENGSRVLALSEQECEEGQTTVKLEVTDRMRPNAFVHIILLQPHGVTMNDLPIRLYGVVPFTVTSPESRLSPVIQAPAEIKPENTYTISVSEKEGKEMAYTLAIVDEGLLDLTRFPTPDPWKAFNAREALGVNTWDLYNLVVGAYGGRIERLFSVGGDDALNKGPKAIVNRFTPVVQFDGPFSLKQGETARHTYRMPNYNGRVKVMVVAGDGEAYGSAEKSVMVRKPLMLLGTLPRTIGVNEEMEVSATVFATEDGMGDVSVSISCGSNMEIIGERTRTLSFTKQDNKLVSFRVRAKKTPGVGEVTITAKGKGDDAVYRARMEIRTVQRPQVKVISAVLDSGEVWTERVPMPGISGTNKMTLEVSAIPPLNLSSRLSYLSDYPHGCLEQTISKAFPALYATSFAELDEEETSSLGKRVEEAIRRLRSYQTADGAFAYWPGGTSSDGWGTVYAAHFLREALDKGYWVTDAMWRNLLGHLSRTARNWKPVASPYRNSEEMTQAYRLYTLASARSPEVGAMNRLREEPRLTSTSRWLLAGAYVLIGRKEVAQELIERATAVSSANSAYDETFGSDVRERSIRLMTLCSLDKKEEAFSLVKELSERLSSEEWLSTQSTAFALVALSDYWGEYKSDETLDFSFECQEKKERIKTDKSLWSNILPEQTKYPVDLRLKNENESRLFIRVITEGVPEQGKEKAYANGLSLAVSYVDMNGRPIDVDRLEQGLSFSAIVTIKNPSSREYGHIVLSEIFPVGWEILNTRFLNGAVTDSLSAGVNYQDIRDDRVYSYIDRLPSGHQVTVKINLRAVYPGYFYLPPVYCEAMYDYLVRANTEGRVVKVE